MDTYRLDSHKLIFHPDRVAAWQAGQDVFPINIEISPSGACNHNCEFCILGFMRKEKATFLSRKVLQERIHEMYALGLRSAVLAGSGEPLLHKEIAAMMNDIKVAGVDVALSTNGVLFTEEVAKEALPALSWIRFSVSGGTEETYKKIQHGRDGDLERVYTNISHADEIRKRYGYETVLGVQIVMTPDNEDEVLLLARKAKELGADWFTVKSLGWNAWTESDLRSINLQELYQGRDELKQELAALSGEGFQATYRENRMAKRRGDRTYARCYAAPFHACIDSSGYVYPCCSLMGMPPMRLGNIYEDSFRTIWLSEHRKTVMDRIASVGLTMCPPDCRLADMNGYLQELKHPGAHVNFI